MKLCLVTFTTFIAIIIYAAFFDFFFSNQI